MTENDNPLILLTNDDGINAPGIHAAYDALVEQGFEIHVVAPETERSAVGHAITLSDPLRVKEVLRDNERFGFSVSGTPADCVKIACWALLSKTPDIVVSGINQGANTGINMLYSGTVSAATEGTILGIPSIAVSLTSFEKSDFSCAADFTADTVGRVIRNGLPPGVYLNINVPALPRHAIKGISVTRQGNAVFRERFDQRVDPRGNKYYWLSGQKSEIENDIEIDEGSVQNGYISVTPVHYDLTHYDSLDRIKKWDLSVPQRT